MTRRLARLFATAALAFSAPVAIAQQAQAPLAAVRAGTAVAVVITQNVDSASARAGDAFSLRLAEPLTLDGQVVVAADPGVVGGGEVVRAVAASRRRMGRLELTARYLQIGGMRVPLQGLTLAPRRYIHRGEFVVPAGTPAASRLAADIPAPLPTPAPPPPPPG